MLGLLVLAVFVFFYKANMLSAYYAVLDAQGIPPVSRPFSDLGAVLNAVRCAHEGVNVYRPSACMQGGVYNYSPLVLKLTFLQIGAHHLLMSGILLDVVFLMSLSSLPAPYSVPELLLRTIAAISSATIFALKRANFDVVIFLVIMLGNVDLSSEFSFSYCRLSDLPCCRGDKIFSHNLAHFDIARACKASIDAGGGA